MKTLSKQIGLPTSELGSWQKKESWQQNRGVTMAATGVILTVGPHAMVLSSADQSVRIVHLSGHLVGAVIRADTRIRIEGLDQPRVVLTSPDKSVTKLRNPQSAVQNAVI